METAPKSLERLTQMRAAELRHWAERAAAEIAFARGLVQLQDSGAREFAPAIDRAERGVQGALLRHADVGALREAVLALESELSPLGEIAKTYSVHCVGHAHIDMNWMWGWPETVQVTLDTFGTVLELMREFPEFTFTQSQASVYELARRYAPELLERIRERVREGRWEVAAAHWVEGDRNLCSGASLCRHLLETRSFVQDLFGLLPEDVPVDWSPDTFGHATTLPSFDARGAVRFYYLCRPGKRELPPVFRWRAPDGKSVIVNRETTWYINAVTPALSDKALSFFGTTGLKDWLFVYGVGDHGGGPTRRDLRRLIEQQSWPIYPRLSFSSARRYFETLAQQAERLPIVEGELNFEFEGCYTSQSAIKRGHRETDRALCRSETSAALAAAVSGVPSEARELSDAWRTLLFSQFHDILPGSGVRETREHIAGAFQQAQAAAGTVLQRSLRALAARVDTSFARREDESELPEYESRALGAGAGFGRGGGLGVVAAGPRPLVAFNSCAWPRREVRTFALWDGDEGPEPVPLEKRNYCVRSANGAAVAAQIVGSGEYWGHRYVELAFEAEVGAWGFTAYAVEEADAALPEQRVRALQSGSGIVLENDRVRCEIDRISGAIVALGERGTGAALGSAGAPLCVLELARERPVSMSAWLLGDVAERQPLVTESVELIDRGPYLARVRCKMRSGESRFELDYRLTSLGAGVDIELSGTWLERGDRERGVPRLELLLPLGFEAARARFEVPYGVIAREARPGTHVPALRFSCVSGLKDSKPCTLSVLTDCKHGFEFSGDALRIALIRSSYDPDPLPEIGKHEMRFRLLPSSLEPSAAELVRCASE
ncbi:MAG TPA: glycoside hydrolase family 38 C-terminal domain-containing protein, partial [Polyangiaceae bacterium]|nr:glycoside hydrolase family 38 C-terminal domain-containing protein [Polyangiaceae bacterium]